MKNTRFNPTMNGYLHAGHACMILVNEYEAANSGGKFIVRLDDTQEYWNDKLGKQAVDNLVSNATYAISKLVKSPYIVTRQSSYVNLQNHILQKTQDEPLMYFHDKLPKHLENFNYYPYTARYTAEKVIMDWLDEIGILIRGADLITEYSLYQYFAEKYKLPFIDHWYLPRLNIDKQEVSKTNCNGDLAKLLSLYGSWEEIVFNLKRAYLKDSKGDWAIQNVKQNPVLQLPK